MLPSVSLHLLLLSALTNLVSASPATTPPNSSPATDSLLYSPQFDDASNLTTLRNKVVIIRHGEKPKDKSLPGLSRAGRKRAQCIRKVFGKSSKHNFGLILAESYNHNTMTRGRPFLTVKHLAQDLGLPVDTTCERDDFKCVRRKVEEFAKTSGKDVLICWKHSFIAEIAKELGASAVRTSYPDKRFDIAWILSKRRVVAKESEKCVGLDDHRKKGRDPDLELDDVEYFDDEEDEVVEGESAWVEHGEAQLRLGSLP
ncbi:hypothetical protein T439DRAFT_327869 [Meredithblackwellia eburnea MCA 4105]